MYKQGASTLARSLPLHLLSYKAIKTLPHRCTGSAPLLHTAMELPAPLPVVEELIKLKVDLLRKDDSGNSAFENAILFGQFDVVKRLAPYQQWRGLSSQQQTRLFRLSLDSHGWPVPKEKIQLFLVEQIYDSGTPIAPELFVDAIDKSNESVVRYLVESGVAWDTTTDANKAHR